MEAESAYARRPPGSAAAAPRSDRTGQAGPAKLGSAQARRAAAVVFALLVVATIGGLFLAQRIKHTPTSVQGFRLEPSSFSPAAAGGATERVSFRTSANDAVAVTIVSSGGETVATLVRNLAWPRYLRLCLAWNGRRGAGGVLRAAPVRSAAGICPAEPAFALPSGRLAPAGDYRVRVSLRRQRHSVLSPVSFALVGGTTGSS
jgi:hypothetical protein